MQGVRLDRAVARQGVDAIAVPSPFDEESDVRGRQHRDAHDKQDGHRAGHARHRDGRRVRHALGGSLAAGTGRGWRADPAPDRPQKSEDAVGARQAGISRDTGKPPQRARLEARSPAA